MQVARRVVVGAFATITAVPQKTPPLRVELAAPSKADENNSS